MTEVSFRNDRGGVIVLNMVKTIQDNAVMLSDIDGAIGDGDHGINMKKGFTIAAERLNGKPAGLYDSLWLLGTVLLTEIGGSMGPLYGTMFREMAKPIKESESIDADTFGTMIQSALDAITRLGGAIVGDKTLVDTLTPAVTAYREAIGAGKNFSEALGYMSDAAQQGKESTRNLVAKIGRSARLGDRSRGVLDAGATSCWLILASMADSVRMLLAS